MDNKLTPDEAFRQMQKEMTDAELVKKVSQQVSEMCKTGGKSFRMTVPVSVNDTDMLISELVRRFNELRSTK